MRHLGKVVREQSLQEFKSPTLRKDYLVSDYAKPFVFEGFCEVKNTKKVRTLQRFELFVFLLLTIQSSNTGVTYAHIKV